MMNTNDDLAHRVPHDLGQSEQAVAPPARTSLSEISRSTIREVSDFLALEADWRQLEISCSPHCNIFQSFDWLKNWALVYAGKDGNAPLHVMLGYRGQRLVFAWPLMRTRWGSLTIFRWMSEPLSQYGDILLAQGENPRAWMEDAITELRHAQDVDAIRLRHVRADAQATPVLQKSFRNARFAEQAPWLDLTVFANEAAYDARYSPAQRKRRKKIRKKLEEGFGTLVFTALRPGAATDDAIDMAIAEKSQWIESRGHQNRALNCAEINTFLKCLARITDGAMQLVVTALTAGGKPVSWEIGLRYGTTHFGFITSHVAALTDYSPARLHMDLSQRQALKDGMTAFDLMLPHDAYKDSWSSAHIEAADYHLPLSKPGFVYGMLYLERLRPLLRHAYYRMPPSLLRLLKPIAGH